MLIPVEPMRILVIEDEADLLTSLAKALREEGYAVDTAPDGEEGLYKAQNWVYDAIVLDVMLPRLDGWTLLKRLRPSKKTPVLMLTARDAVRDRVRGLDSGADDYLSKPFDLVELFARLRALIRRAAGLTQNVIEIGEWVIETAARRVTRSGQPVTAKWSPAPPSTNTCSTKMTTLYPTSSTCMSPIYGKN
jgi:two-component system OmpR family response regulator